MSIKYNYHEAVSRNIGWISEWEQLALRHKTVAIAGMGGVGGSHLITLARLGIGHFKIADLDTFEVANFNRQIGANMATLGREKVDVLAEQAMAINPDVHIKTFPKGIDSHNIDAFLEGVDVFVDGFDFFVLDIRAKVLQRCWERNIPAITAAPIGLGTAYLIFLPQQMTFEEYFCLQGLEPMDQYVNFAVGLTPKAYHRHYLVDPSRLDLVAKKGPSTIMAINLCAGVVATEVLKLITGRGKVYAAPYFHQFDAYTGSYTRGKLRWGNQGFFQKIKCKIGYKQFRALSDKAITQDTSHYPQGSLEDILDLARWSPSGDNQQPWHFDLKDASTVLIQCADTRAQCVYDLHGKASQIAIGALLESIRIAATAFGKRVEIVSEASNVDAEYYYTVTISDEDHIQKNPLVSELPLRTTQRRAFSRKKLSQADKLALQHSIGDDYTVIWVEAFGRRRQFAKMLYDSAHIRLTIPEAYSVHCQIIAWDAQFSRTKIPGRAVGLDNANLTLMKWAMTTWERVLFLNRYLAGTIVPRIQLDYIPAIFCGAHYCIVKKSGLTTPADFISGGAAVQRFWLTATQLGLAMQPEMTPLIFSQYAEQEVQFTNVTKALNEARQIQLTLDQLIGAENRQKAVFMGRIGFGSRPTSRSIRKSLHDLTH